MGTWALCESACPGQLPEPSCLLPTPTFSAHLHLSPGQWLLHHHSSSVSVPPSDWWTSLDGYRVTLWKSWASGSSLINRAWCLRTSATLAPSWFSLVFLLQPDRLPCCLFLRPTPPASPRMLPDHTHSSKPGPKVNKVVHFPAMLSKLSKLVFLCDVQDWDYLLCQVPL